MENCSHRKIKIDNLIGDTDQEDVRRVMCSDCGYILEETVISRTRGEVDKPRIISKRNPLLVNLVSEEAEVEDIVLPTAAQMLEYANFIKEEQVGKRSRLLAKEILDHCAEKVLDGKADYLVKEEDNVPGEIINVTVKELKDRGYKISKVPSPGEGTWLKINWPTKKAASVKKVKPLPPQEKPPLTPSEDKKRKAALVKKRKQALKQVEEMVFEFPKKGGKNQ